jgi:hypothetical protein
MQLEQAVDPFIKNFHAMFFYHYLDLMTFGPGSQQAFGIIVM